MQLDTPVHQSKLEEKFRLVPQHQGQFLGKHPLEPFAEGGRGSYGGDFVAQSLLAAWETVGDLQFQPHSLHGYFLKAGLAESVMRYEVENTSDGRNFCSRLVRCFQLHSNVLCFMLMVSFTKDNSVSLRKQKFAQLPMEEQHHERAKVPFEFLRQPLAVFDKYIDRLDELPTIQHTNDNLVHAIPPETFRVQKHERGTEPPLKNFGLFARVNDDLTNAGNLMKARFVDLAFLSDSFYLGTMMRAVNVPLTDSEAMNFFRVSLDHSICFHDSDFDPTEWMFIDYRFVRMSNDRILVNALFFSRDKRLVATVQQEAIAFLPMRVVQKTSGGSYKL